MEEAGVLGFLEDFAAAVTVMIYILIQKTNQQRVIFCAAGNEVVGLLGFCEKR